FGNGQRNRSQSRLRNTKKEKPSRISGGLFCCVARTLSVYGNFWFPSYVELFHRFRFVQPSDYLRSRRASEKFRILFCLFTDLDHRIAERIQSFFRFGFRRLNHETLWNDEREVVRWWVETVVNKPLADIQGSNSELLILLRSENAFMHAWALVGW